MKEFSYEDGESCEFVSQVIAEDAALRDLRTPIKRLNMCPHQQKEQDRKLRAALLAEFNDTAIADRVMRVIKGERG